MSVAGWVMMQKECWSYPCPLLPGRYNEEHRREDIPPDQRGDHVRIRGWSMTRSWISRRRWSMWIPQQMLEARVGVLLFAAEPATPADLLVDGLSRRFVPVPSVGLDTLRRDGHNVRVVVCN